MSDIETSESGLVNFGSEVRVVARLKWICSRLILVSFSANGSNEARERPIFIARLIIVDTNHSPTVIAMKVGSSYSSSKPC